MRVQVLFHIGTPQKQYHKHDAFLKALSLKMALGREFGISKTWWIGRESEERWRIGMMLSVQFSTLP